MTEQNYSTIDRVTYPIRKFMQQEKAGGIVLGISVIIALILANSPLSHDYHHFLEHKLGFQFDGKPFLEYSIHHWINDGLMSIFFFILGLNLIGQLPFFPGSGNVTGNLSVTLVLAVIAALITNFSGNKNYSS